MYAELIFAVALLEFLMFDKCEKTAAFVLVATSIYISFGGGRGSSSTRLR